MDTTGSARPNRTASHAALCLVVAVLAPAAASAVPGAPDTTFGPGGIRVDPTLEAGGPEDATYLDRIVPLGGNGIAAVTRAHCGMECRAAVIARYLPTGLPDAGFATNGKLTLLTVWNEAAVWTVPVVAHDGSMTTMGGGHLVRYLPDGTIGTDTPSATSFVPVGVAPDGRIIGRTDAYLQNAWNYTVALYHPDGSIDSSVRPVVSLTMPTVTVARGSVWVAFPSAARPGVPAGRSVRLVRRLLDGSTGTSSRVSIQSPGTRRTVLRVQRILVGRAGRATLVCQLKRTQVLVGVAPGGSRNRRFGSRGLVFPSHPQFVPSAAAIQRDGRIVLVSGSPTHDPTSSTLTVRRLTDSGRSDPTFPVRRVTVKADILSYDVVVDDAGRAVVGFGATPPKAYSSQLYLLRLLAK